MRGAPGGRIDLAARPAKTAAGLIEWDATGRGRVSCPAEGATDTDLLTQMGSESISVTSIDAPFGWPVEFAESLAAYAHSGAWPEPPEQQHAALIERAWERGHVLPVSDPQAGRIEGWIQLPEKESLSALGPGAKVT